MPPNSIIAQLGATLSNLNVKSARACAHFPEACRMCALRAHTARYRTCLECAYRALARILHAAHAHTARYLTAHTAYLTAHFVRTCLETATAHPRATALAHTASCHASCMSRACAHESAQTPRTPCSLASARTTAQPHRATAIAPHPPMPAPASRVPFPHTPLPQFHLMAPSNHPSLLSWSLDTYYGCGV
jgi:hypothetical protein